MLTPSVPHGVAPEPLAVRFLLRRRARRPTPRLADGDARLAHSMKALTTTVVRERLATAQALDRLWSETMGLPDGDSKEGPLRLVAQLLAREGVPCPDRWRGRAAALRGAPNDA